MMNSNFYSQNSKWCYMAFGIDRESLPGVFKRLKCRRMQLAK